jgi:D-glycero-D-manno-heptose 1,7-bisphosphate phosphatase
VPGTRVHQNLEALAAHLVQREREESGERAGATDFGSLT